ncbi:MAG: ABC transporter substrate-binding protein [Opitutales bacterium]|nr:ABC transporter substrate-binding protein [Opitutales bacterium]
MTIRRKLFVLCVLIAGSTCLFAKEKKATLRIGFFPNLTHAQGVIGAYTDKQADLESWFGSRLGDEVELQWYCFNAGPSAMEALFAGSIDITYVGPNPSLNAYMRSEGEEIRILSGSCRGGAALLVHPESGIEIPEDFKGKKIATPQLGNTQDIACRYWLMEHGLRISQIGGDAFVIPTKNPDQLNLFEQKKLDAVYTVEPWVSVLEVKGGAKCFYEESDSLVTVLACGSKALEERKALVESFLQAHKELTQWIIEHPEEAKELVSAGIAAEVHRPLDPEIVENAWKRLHFGTEVSVEDYEQIADAAEKAGFLKKHISLDRLIAPIME